MKLQALHEAGNSTNFSEIDEFLPTETANDLKKSLNTFLKGFKFVNTETKDTDSKLNIAYNFTNGLIAEQIYLIINADKSGDPYVIVTVHGFVEDKFLTHVKSETDKLLLEVSDFFDAKKTEKIQKLADTGEKFQEVIKEFSDWYFEMSAEYGTVKLFPTQYNVLEGYHRGGEYRFVAIAGDFHTSRDPLKNEIKKRVL